MLDRASWGMYRTISQQLFNDPGLIPSAMDFLKENQSENEPSYLGKLHEVPIIKKTNVDVL